MPQKQLKGKCISCGSEMIAKCGDVKLHHWAHKGKRHCDPWWENETEWHRGWKNLFPEDWREVPSKDENGVKHIADIKRPDGFFIEFQNSAISIEEVESRNLFYKNLVWVVNGCRSVLDLEKSIRFSGLITCEGIVDVTSMGLRVCNKWKKLASHIFIDFKDNSSDGRKRIFYLISVDKCDLLCELQVEDFVLMAKSRGGMKPFIQKAHKLKDEVIKSIDEKIAIENENKRKRREWEKKFIDPFR